MPLTSESETKLVHILLKNSRMSHSTIGSEMNKSRNWVARIVRRLVERGIIRGYTTVLDPAQVYAERNTILLVRTNPRELDISEALIKMPELESLDGISGDHSLLGLFRFRSPTAFEYFLDTVDKTMVKSGTQTYKIIQVLSTYKTQGFILERSDPQSTQLTIKEWELLSVIRRVAASTEKPFPLTQDQIGKAMNPPLSQSAVSKAMQRLESKNVIVGYSADVDFKQVGMPIKFFLEIRPKPGRIARAAQKIMAMHQVWDLHRVSQDYGLFATVRTESVDAYNSFLRELYTHEDVLDTQSQISLEEWFLSG